MTAYALLFPGRVALLLIELAVIYAYSGAMLSYIRSRENGDLLAAGVWLIAAGAAVANANQLSSIIFGTDVVEVFMSARVFAHVSLGILLAGFFLLWSAWYAAVTATPSRKVAFYSAGALLAAATIAGVLFSYSAAFFGIGRAVVHVVSTIG